MWRIFAIALLGTTILAATAHARGGGGGGSMGQMPGISYTDMPPYQPAHPAKHPHKHAQN